MCDIIVSYGREEQKKTKKKSLIVSYSIIYSSQVQGIIPTNLLPGTHNFFFFLSIICSIKIQVFDIYLRATRRKKNLSFFFQSSALFIGFYRTEEKERGKKGFHSFSSLIVHHFDDASERRKKKTKPNVIVSANTSATLD